MSRGLLCIAESLACGSSRHSPRAVHSTSGVCSDEENEHRACIQSLLPFFSTANHFLWDFTHLQGFKDPITPPKPISPVQTTLSITDLTACPPVSTQGLHSAVCTVLDSPFIFHSVVLELQVHAVMPGFHVDAVGPNSSPHNCTELTIFIEPPPQSSPPLRKSVWI